MVQGIRHRFQCVGQLGGAPPCEQDVFGSRCASGRERDDGVQRPSAGHLQGARAATRYVQQSRADTLHQGKTQCYDCTPKEAPKSFPVCTIRSTPSQPIHCIVWAKSYLFTEIFGTSEDDAPELDHSEDSENAKEIENLRSEAQALKRIRESMGSEEFPKLVFDKVFKEDIERLRSMEDMWKTRKAPIALDFEALSQELTSMDKDIVHKDQKTWTVAENFAVFLDSLRRLSDRMEETRANVDTGNSPPILTFDKDDADTLDFVAASANLRSIVFGIEGRSKFDIKREYYWTVNPNLAYSYRNGWQHHSCYRNYECDDCIYLRSASFQGHARRACQRKQGSGAGQRQK